MLVCCVLFNQLALAQSKVKIQGVVKSESGEPLPGVSVLIKETKQGTQTGPNGEFTINAAVGQLLLFNYMGFNPKAVSVAKAGNITVTLEEAITAMNEVVVVGYGSLKKSAITSAVSKLENKNLDEIPTSRLDNALIGKIAGVTVQNVSSEAGAEPVVRVRGFNSISADSSPLVVVDGYPVPDGLSFVNPQDVESIEVLKDAASASIYGSRAANGVILITTKSGTPDKPRISLKSYYGFKNPYKLHPILSMSEYVDKLYAEAALRENDPSVAANRKNLITNQERAAYIIENQITGYATDWQDLALNDDAGIYNIQLGISGGKKDLKYYISGSMQKDEGIMKFSQNERTTFKAKVDGNLTKKLKFSINFNPTYIKTNRPAANYTDYYRWYSFVPDYHNEFTAAYVRQNAQWANINPGDYAQARHFNGLAYSGYMPDGTFWTSPGTIDPWSTQNNTPLSIASRESRARTAYRILTSGDLSYEILPKLIFKTSLGGYYNFEENTTFTQSNAKQDGAVNQALVTGTHFKDLLWENTLNYAYSKKKHNFTGLLGYTVQQTWIDNSSMAGLNFPTENFQTLNQAAQIDQSRTFTIKDRVGLVSYLGRITYDYNSKYMLAASFRTDGSSYFASGRKYGFFPSVSAGWNITSEPFMRDITWLTTMKLRTSYGATGNNKITSFSYQDLLNPANYGFGAGTGNVNLGLSPNSPVIANPLITWERTFESNTGLDLAFLQNKFNLSFEYYRSITDKLLFNQAAMAFTGSEEFINNIGKVRNNGVEIEFSSNNIKSKNFEWTSSINFSRNKNKLLELGGEPFQYNYGERNEIYAAIVGQPSIQFFGYKTQGVWKSDAEIKEAQKEGLTSSITNFAVPGGLRYVDTNGDRVVNTDDRVVLGTPFPDFTWGFSNAFKYKGFDLNILVQGSQGGKLINGDAYYNETKRFNKNYNSDNRWLSEMYPGDGKTPYFTSGADWMVSDHVLEDASYISLRNVILGYTVPKKSIKKLGINAVRVYASADNLAYFMGKGYRGINPEARVTSNQYQSPLITGYQRGAFPLMQTFTFGLDFNF